ncbi:hypothetical protein ACLB1M_02390 [Escherichia coli]
MKPLNWRPSAEQAALQADNAITNTEGGSFNSHYGVKVFWQQPRHVAGLLLYASFTLQLCNCQKKNGDMERDYAYTIGAVRSAICKRQSGLGPTVLAVLYRACHRVNSPP